MLFVFQQSHDLWIATGYGLEGALPDALCKRIIENEIVPRFRAGDFGGGLSAGVHAMMAATRGEYHGTGHTQRESRSPIAPQQGLGGFIAFLFFIAMVVLSAIISRRRNTVYGSRGRHTVWTGTPWDGGWGGRRWRQLWRGQFWWRWRRLVFRRRWQFRRRRRRRKMVMNLSLMSPSIDHARIVEAIQAAEKRTSGEIRVVVARRSTPDAMETAKRHFERLGMTKTAARNGVLILIAPASRTFAVIGDTAIHEKCGDEFWRQLVDAMAGHFQRGAFTEGILHGIERAATILAEHFPAQANDRNELSDDVEEV